METIEFDTAVLDRVADYCDDYGWWPRDVELIVAAASQLDAATVALAPRPGGEYHDVPTGDLVRLAGVDHEATWELLERVVEHGVVIRVPPRV